MTGVEMIAKERDRHAVRYDAKHDDAHVDGELALAAIAYAAPEPAFIRSDYFVNMLAFCDPWPWEDGDGRPVEGEAVVDPRAYPVELRIRLLTKAGALVAAEIDRLLRKETAARGVAEIVA